MTTDFAAIPPPPMPPMNEVPPYPVRLEVDYPEHLSRGLLFVKWLLIIPHWWLLSLLVWGSAFATFLSWWAILFTGRYPRSLFEFNVAVQQWSARVNGYAVLLATDEYPPFSLGRSSTGTAVLMVVLGTLCFVAVIVAYTALVVAAVMSHDSSSVPLRAY